MQQPFAAIVNAEHVPIQFTPIEFFFNQKHPQAIAVMDAKGAHSYHEVAQLTRKLCFVLRNQMGVKTGDIVTVKIKNNVMGVCALLAGLQLGFTIVLSDGGSTAYGVQQLQKETGSLILLLDSVFADYSYFANFQSIVILGESNIVEQTKQVVNFTLKYIEQAEEETFSANVLTSSVAHIAFTSGTTSSAKPCCITFRDLIVEMEAFCDAWKLNHEDRVTSLVENIGGSYGAQVLLLTLHIGAVYQRANLSSLEHTIPKLATTVIFSVPELVRRVTKSCTPNWKLIFKSVRFSVVCGEHAAAALLQDAEMKCGKPFLTMFGSTELNACIANRLEETKLGSLGKPLMGFKVQILGSENEPLGVNCIGRLAIQGPTRCYYLHRPELQSAYVYNGWNVTGDLASYDEDGFVWYCGRQDSLWQHLGTNIPTEIIANALCKNPNVERAAIVAYKASQNHTALVKAVVVKRTNSVSDQDLEAALREMVKTELTSKYYYPELYEFVPMLPVNSTGKVSHKAVQQMFGGCNQ